MKRKLEIPEDDTEVTAITDEAEVKIQKIDKKQLYKPLCNDELHQLKETENLFHSSVFKLQEIPEDDIEVTAVTDEAEVKIQKIDKKQLYKPLSNDELHQLKETENLFHSSVFKLQITELLNEVRLKEKRIGEICGCIQKLKSVLLNLPRGKEHDLQDNSWLSKHVNLPLPVHKRAIKGRFQFLPPVDVQEVGSFATGTCLKPHPSIDLAVTIPKDFFQPKDYLNHRYLQKRALYLSVIALKLRKNKNVHNLKFTYHHGNTFKPILIFQYTGEGKEINFHLHVSVEEGAFKYNRFHINKNNVRRSWFNGQESEDTTDDDPPTPHYNTAILQDLLCQSNSKCLTSALQDAGSIKEGITLLKIWLQQRELSFGYGGFSGFIMAMYVLHLLRKKHLNKMMSSYQILRNTLLHLSQEDWSKSGPDLCGDKSDPNQPTHDDFHQTFDCVFVDVTGYLNLCSEMSKSTFLRVKHEAELAMKFLEDKTIDSFQILFMLPVKFCRKFDNIFHISNVSQLKESVEKLKKTDKLLDYGGHYIHAVLPDVMSLLRKALDKRIELCQIKQDQVPEWDVDSSPPCITDTKITVGIILNPEFAFSTIDKGPPADSPEAKEFREFWGEKSELRRFRDGSITEAVPWTKEKTMNRRRIVCSYVVKEVLKRWASITDVTYIGDQLDEVLSLPVKSCDGKLDYGTGEEQHAELLQSYDNLCKVIRNLKELPLTISSIQGTSPVFRFTEVFPVLPATFYCYAKVNTKKNDPRLLPLPDKPCPPYTACTKVVCLLEGSGQWPEDKDAFQRIKAALHIKLGEILSNQHALPVVIHTDHVDIRYEDFVYRLELQYMREIALLKKVTTSDGMVRFVDNEEALTLEKNIKLLPVLTSTLHGIQQKYNSFSGSVRLAKRWISSQLLADHVPDVAIELLVAYLYTSHAPYTTPNNPMVGFLRFLNLLSTHDWKMSPIIVNLNSEFKGEDYSDITSKFTKSRAGLPLMFISTPTDRYQSVWTRNQPTAMILHRLVLLARECLNVIESQIISLDLSSVDFKQIFRPSLEDFNLLIHLRIKQIPKQLWSVDKPKNIYNPLFGDELEEGYQKCLPVYDFDPVQKFLQEIRELHGDIALFFYDTYGGNVIGVLFNPNAFKQKDFKVNHMFSRKPDASQNGQSDVVLKLNMEAVINDFKVIGGGLVTSVQIQNCDL